jgi:hypothetical protein
MGIFGGSSRSALSPLPIQGLTVGACSVAMVTARSGGFGSRRQHKQKASYHAKHVCLTALEETKTNPTRS